MKTRIVTTLDIPELEPYRTLRRPMEHHRHGIFVAEGEKVVQRLLESELTVLSVLLTPEWLSILHSALEAGPNIEVYVAPKRLVESIVGFPLHQGIMAVGKVPWHRTITEILPTLAQPYLLAAIDGLTNAENIGVLVRNCVAFGAQALIVGETSSSPYLRRAVRNSMGAVFQLPVVETTDLAQTIRGLRQHNDTSAFAAHPGGAGELAYTKGLNQNCCIVFGSEGEGISEQVLKACNAALSIRMENRVDSLNVGSASAVFLYEIAKQRRV